MLNGKLISLRALEKSDLEFLYLWENNSDNWLVSGTLAPFSKDVLFDFITNSDKDIYTTKQLRFIIETTTKLPIGTIDLFDFDPANKRAGVGILIGDKNYRHKGCATEALLLLELYCQKVLKLHQLHCQIDEENLHSINLFCKLGFEKTGIKRDWLLDYNNRYRNVGFYQKIIGD